jgi:hypothetical protein
MARWLIGIDDTDFGDSIGTGALARELALHLERLTGASNRGITRHQLLVDPRIPYTSHNSAACLELEGDTTIDELEELTRAFVTTLLHTGADPGICLLQPNGIDLTELTTFGRDAQSRVLDKSEARQVSERARARQHELGGSGLGIIGATAACGLRLSGDDGRFISLPGTRELDGVLTVAEILGQGAIDQVVDDTGRALEKHERVDTRGWVRPDLVGGRVVLRSQRDRDGYVVVRDKHMDKH